MKGGRRKDMVIRIKALWGRRGRRAGRLLARAQTGGAAQRSGRGGAQFLLPPSEPRPRSPSPIQRPRGVHSTPQAHREDRRGRQPTNHHSTPLGSAFFTLRFEWLASLRGCHAPARLPRPPPTLRCPTASLRTQRVEPGLVVGAECGGRGGQEARGTRARFLVPRA